MQTTVWSVEAISASSKHLHRYLAEFDLRYNNRVALGCIDTERADMLLKDIIGNA